MAMNPANQEMALAVLEKYNKNTPRALQEKQLTATRDLVWPDRTKDIGRIDVKAWQQTEQIMLEQGLIKSTVKIEAALIIP